MIKTINTVNKTPVKGSRLSVPCTNGNGNQISEIPCEAITPAAKVCPANLTGPSTDHLSSITPNKTKIPAPAKSALICCPSLKTLLIKGN